MDEFCAALAFTGGDERVVARVFFVFEADAAYFATFEAEGVFSNSGGETACDDAGLKV